MATTLEDLRVLKVAEQIADGIWKQGVKWDGFARDVVGKQLTRAADSIGANIAESYGRYHYGEKLQFLYFARGSLFETKYWLNRVSARQLMPASTVQTYAEELSDLAHQINTFAGSIKRQRTTEKPSSQIREASMPYAVTGNPTLDDFQDEDTTPLFTDNELESIQLSIDPNLSISKSPNLRFDL